MQEYIDKRKLIFDHQYLEYLHARDMNEFYLDNLKEAKDLLRKRKVKDDNYYFDSYKLSRIDVIYNMNFRFKDIEKSFNHSTESLDNFYIFQKMWTAINIVFLKLEKIGEAGLHNILENEVISHVESRLNNFRKEHPYIYVMYLSYKMFTEFDDKYYDQLERYYRNNKSKFTGVMASTYFTYLHFYLRLKEENVSEYHSEYDKKQYRLYIKIFDSDDKFRYLFINGKLEDSLYLNVISNYLLNGDINRANSFIIKFRNHLNKDSRSDAYNYALSIYHGKMNDYRAAVKYLLRISGKFPLYQYNRKLALVRYYYMLQEYELLETELTNLYQFGYRNKEIGRRFRKAILIFIKYARLLIKLRTDKTLTTKEFKSERQSLKKQIENEKMVLLYKKWFLRMVEEMGRQT